MLIKIDEVKIAATTDSSARIGQTFTSCNENSVHARWHLGALRTKIGWGMLIRDLGIQKRHEHVFEAPIIASGLVAGEFMDGVSRNNIR